LAAARSGVAAGGFVIFFAAGFFRFIRPHPLPWGGTIGIFEGATKPDKSAKDRMRPRSIRRAGKYCELFLRSL